MELSKGSMAGITIAIVALFIASFATFVYLRRRRRRQRRAANATTTTNTSATTSSTAPSSHKNNASESHALQPRKKLPTELNEYHAQEPHTQDLELGNGFGPTQTGTVNKKRHTVPTDSQGLLANKTPFPALGVPTTTAAAAATSSDVVANGEAYATDAGTGIRSTAPARLTADFGIDLEQQSHFTFLDRPSSLHQAVLEVGGRDEETADVGRTSRDGETKTEISHNIVKDVSQRPTGYTGAWP